MTDHTNNILLTGYWPPTNRMLSQFSKIPRLNPEGWRGRNWRNRGFDIYAYFPEFDDETHPGAGHGDLRVEYRDTLRDFNRITGLHRPCAIVTFSRGRGQDDWELEIGARNRENWIADLSETGQPDPNPPDDSVPSGFWRPSTLPMDQIRKAVNNAGLNIRAHIDRTGNLGRFLSEYIAYLGLKYQEEHCRDNNGHLCVAAGHIHVGRRVEVAEARVAVEITLEEVIKELEYRLQVPGQKSG